MVQIGAKEWRAEAARRYGADHMKWKFRCPACGHVASVDDWKNAKAPETAAGFSCIGRWSTDRPREAFTGKGGNGPCNYAGGGLFKLNPIHVVGSDGLPHAVFDFADEPLAIKNSMGAAV